MSCHAMSVPPTLEQSLQRLSAALARLEDAVERRRESDRAHAAREIETQALNEDRARLASELDEVFARAARLEHANRDVSRRLDAAMETICSVLEAQEG
jgi:predicted  nucleic acid-binding Zn-ribbon protein